MAMKFAKALAAVTYLTLFAFVISSCGTTPAKENIALQVDALDLQPSAQFIPVISKTKDGLPIVYTPSPDPYSLLKGRIDKEVITRFIESKRALAKKDFDNASDIAKLLTQSEPGLSGPWVLLGDIAVEESKYATAEDHYKKAIEVNELNINAYVKLALVQRMQGKYLLAQNTYVAVLEKWSDYPEAHLNLAILYDIYLNHPLRAQRHYEAYQFLTKGRDTQSAEWLAEIRRRTGLPIQLAVGDDQAPELSANE